MLSGASDENYESPIMTDDEVNINLNDIEHENMHSVEENRNITVADKIDSNSKYEMCLLSKSNSPSGLICLDAP